MLLSLLKSVQNLVAPAGPPVAQVVPAAPTSYTGPKPASSKPAPQPVKHQAKDKCAATIYPAKANAKPDATTKRSRSVIRTLSTLTRHPLVHEAQLSGYKACLTSILEKALCLSGQEAEVSVLDFSGPIDAPENRQWLPQNEPGKAPAPTRPLNLHPRNHPGDGAGA